MTLLPTLELFLISSCLDHTEADGSAEGLTISLPRGPGRVESNEIPAPGYSALRCLLCSALAACIISLG